MNIIELYHTMFDIQRLGIRDVLDLNRKNICIIILNSGTHNSNSFAFLEQFIHLLNKTYMYNVFTFPTKMREKLNF